MNIELSAAQRAKYASQLLNRKNIAKIINNKPFWKYDFYVNNFVLDPRPETELIIEEVLNIYKNKNSNSGNFISDSNILNVTILQNDKKDIDDIINKLKPNFKYLKLKSANIEKATSNYIFWYESNSENFEDMLKNISKLSDENVNISIYSKSGAFE